MVVNVTVDLDTSEIVWISTGGPLATVIWKINNELLLINDGSPYQQSQRIASKENAAFEYILHIPSDSIANYNPKYECLVMNSVGNDSMSLRLEGKWITVDKWHVIKHIHDITQPFCWW